MSPRVKITLTTAVISLLINSYYVFANYYAVSPNGSTTHLWLSGLLFLFVLAFLIIFLIALPLAIVKKFRSKVINTLIVTILFVTIAIICIRIGASIRNDAFFHLADRSSVLIAAIENYKNEKGSPPKTLAELVPKYLPKVPSTKMGAYPEYGYLAGEEAQRYDGNPWVIVIQTPSGGINWDLFIYFPLQNYHKRGYGGSLEIIKNWAYVHE